MAGSDANVAPRRRYAPVIIASSRQRNPTKRPSAAKPTGVSMAMPDNNHFTANACASVTGSWKILEKSSAP